MEIIHEEALDSLFNILFVAQSSSIKRKRKKIEKKGKGREGNDIL